MQQGRLLCVYFKSDIRWHQFKKAQLSNFYCFISINTVTNKIRENMKNYWIWPKSAKIFTRKGSVNQLKVH